MCRTGEQATLPQVPIHHQCAHWFCQPDRAPSLDALCMMGQRLGTDQTASMRISGNHCVTSLLDACFLISKLLFQDLLSS